MTDTTRHHRHYFLRLGRWLQAYSEHLGDYMRRWILQLPNGSTRRLHHILRSDAGRDLHDHPWDFTSFLLTGGYTEVRPLTSDPNGPTESVWHPRFSVVRHKAEDLHRLVLDAPVWTVVWTGPKCRTWGFQTRRGWVDWRVYHGAEEPAHRNRSTNANPTEVA